jgi:hypothetical protein
MKTLEKKTGKVEEKAKDGAKAQEKRAAEVRTRVEERTKDFRKADRTAVRARAEAATARKARRIEMLEAQIKKMSEELKRLKAEGDEDEKG